MENDQAPLDKPFADQNNATRINANRIVLLVIATACMFAFTSLYQDGTCIFPFPLYEIGMALSAGALIMSERKKSDLLVWLALTWCLLQMLSSQFLLEILLNQAQLEDFFTSYFPDIVLGAACLVFFAWGVMISRRIGSAFRRRLSIFSFACFSILYLIAISPYLQYHIGLMNSNSGVLLAEKLVYFAGIPLLAAAAMIAVDGQKMRPHFHILLLFTFFYLTEYGTLLFIAR